MRKLEGFLFCLLLLLSFQAKGQGIPNPSFDSIYIGGIDRIFNWVTMDGFSSYSGFNMDTILPLEPNTYYDAQGFAFSELLWHVNLDQTTPYSTNAIRLQGTPYEYKRGGEYFVPFIACSDQVTTDADGYIDFSKIGAPFSGGQPAVLNGYYQYLSGAPIENWGHCVILLTKYNSATNQRDTIGYKNSISDLGPVNQWSSFSIEIDYFSTEDPDTLMILFEPTIYPGMPGSLWIDELSFGSSPNAVSKSKEKLEVALFPNPNSGTLHLESVPSWVERIVFYAPSGKKVGERSMQETLLLPSGDWPFLLVEFLGVSGQSFSKKVILR